jgi:hypothetical protein
MRNIRLVLLAIFAFASCDDTSNTNLQVANNSTSYTVGFKLLHSDTGTLAPGEVGYYSDYYANYAFIEEYYSSPVNYRVTPTYPHKNKVEFVDTPPISLNINNTLAVSITINDDKYMSPDSITVTANTTDNSGTIFTTKPIFTVTAGGYPVSYEYAYDASGPTLYVTVK